MVLFLHDKSVFPLRTQFEFYVFQVNVYLKKKIDYCWNTITCLNNKKCIFGWNIQEIKTTKYVIEMIKKALPEIYIYIFSISVCCWNMEELYDKTGFKRSIFHSYQVK